MNLKEVLEKATKRPWDVDAWTALTTWTGYEGDSDKADGILLTHAVNNLEELLEVAKEAQFELAQLWKWILHKRDSAVLPPVRGIRRKLAKAIRQAEVVAPCSGESDI